MEDRWKYVGPGFNCYVNLAGDVMQYDRIIEPRVLEGTRHRVVDIEMDTTTYDYERGEFTRTVETMLVWQLMRFAWFAKWPSDGHLIFLDNDPWNCSADNIRVWSHARNRVVQVRDEGYAFVFDKRLVGEIEISPAKGYQAWRFPESFLRVSGVSEAARVVGGTRSGVSLVLSGRLRTHQGCHFRWI